MIFIQISSFVIVYAQSSPNDTPQPLSDDSAQTPGVAADASEETGTSQSPEDTAEPSPETSDSPQILDSSGSPPDTSDPEKISDDGSFQVTDNEGSATEPSGANDSRQQRLMTNMSRKMIISRLSRQQSSSRRALLRQEMPMILLQMLLKITA